MVEHLIHTGRKNIIHLAGPSYIRNAVERRKGYEDALKKFHLPFQPEYIMDAGVDFEGGEKAMEQLVRKGISFDAVFSFTEMSALGAKSHLQKQGYIIPQDVAICCISGTVLCELVHPTITSVEQPVEKMATEAVRLLIDKLSNPFASDETVVLDAEMRLRESTGTNME